jgi:competence protein ComEC
MRGNVIASVLGSWLLQQQAVLPNLAWAGLLPLLWLSSRFAPGGFLLVRSIPVKFVFLGLGFFWAAFMAQLRLSDALPSAWEGRDIQLVGVVSSLPVGTERGISARTYRQEHLRYWQSQN